MEPDRLLALSAPDAQRESREDRDTRRAQRKEVLAAMAEKAERERREQMKGAAAEAHDPPHDWRPATTKLARATEKLGAGLLDRTDADRKRLRTGRLRTADQVERDAFDIEVGHASKRRNMALRRVILGDLTSHELFQEWHRGTRSLHDIEALRRFKNVARGLTDGVRAPADVADVWIAFMTAKLLEDGWDREQLRPELRRRINLYATKPPPKFDKHGLNPEFVLYEEIKRDSGAIGRIKRRLASRQALHQRLALFGMSTTEPESD